MANTSNSSKSPFAALVNPAVVQAAAQRAERLDLPRKTSKAFAAYGRDVDDDEDDELDLGR